MLTLMILICYFFIIVKNSNSLKNIYWCYWCENILKKKNNNYFFSKLLKNIGFLFRLLPKLEIDFKPENLLLKKTSGIFGAV